MALNRVVNRRPPARRPPARSAESEAVIRFRKVLELELRRGCDDGAVIGGVDRFLAIARQDRGVAALIDAAPALAKGYRGLAPPQRERWLRAVLAAKPAAAKAKTAARGSSASPRAESAPARPEALEGRAAHTPADPPDPPGTGGRGP